MIGLSRFRWPHWPLSNQNRLTSIVLVAFAVAIVAFIFMRRERRALESGLQAESVVVLNAIEAAAEDLLYRLDVDGLQQLMDAIGEQHPVVSSRIYDSQGRIIADATGTETLFCIEPDSFGQRALQSDTKDFEWYSDRLLVVRAVRAGPELIGAISVGLSTDKLFNQVAEVRIRVATLATTIFISGAFIALFISRSVTRPLRDLTNAVRRIKLTNLDQNVPVGGEDEVGRLARAFNSTIGQLRDEIARRERTEIALQEERTHAAQDMHDGLAQMLATCLATSQNHTCSNPLVGSAPQPLGSFAGRQTVRVKRLS